MRRLVRIAVATIVCTAAIGISVSVAEALEPFPPGDDQVRAFLEFDGDACGPGVKTSIRTLHRENIPAGAEYYIRYWRNGVVNEHGPFELDEGTGTDLFGSFSFGPLPYPTTVGIHYRVDVGGRPTYVGGTTISCASPEADAVESEYEDFSPPCGVEGTPAFPDVPASHPFCLDIARAVLYGITEGYPDGDFRPTRAITRQAMAAFMYRSENRGAPDPTCTEAVFPDVPADHPFCGVIDWMVSWDITTGYADGSFRPGDDVTRQATAAFLYRLKGSPDGEDPPCAAAAFPDVPVEHPFCGEIEWLVAQAITTGYDDGSFRPTTDVTRQAMAAFLKRADAV